jgi:glycerol-3-phosphate acyltransferase PlsX
MRIAVDAMGGDFAPRQVVDGAMSAARQFGCGIVLVGRREVVERELGRHGDLAGLDVTVADAPDVVAMGEAPAAALRRRPGASIRVAADLVARGEAAALFSAGHTGATVVAAHNAFGMLPGVDRPALATPVPTRRRRPAVLVDAGATVECRPHHLVQFAIMGAVFARVALGIEHPRVGLLSIGEEATKGTDLTREAHRLLAATSLNFIGNLEARDAYSGEADVIVCDGFTGNVALKVSEGLVETVEHLLREELTRTFTTRVGYLLSRRAFRRFQKRVDASEYGGAPLVGVAGLCIVGHGRSSAKAVRSAVGLAARFVAEGFLERLGVEIAALCAGAPARTPGSGA